MSRKGFYDPGPPCRVCGCAAVNVSHDDEATRRRNIELWAGPSASMGGKDYYTWAGVEYHPFQPVTSSSPRTDYERGYQAGYKAGMRRAGT